MIRKSQTIPTPQRCHPQNLVDISKTIRIHRMDVQIYLKTQQNYSLKPPLKIPLYNSDAHKK